MARTACLGCVVVAGDDGSTFPMYVSGCPTHDQDGEQHPSATVQSWYVDGQPEKQSAALEEKR